MPFYSDVLHQDVIAIILFVVLRIEDLDDVIVLPELRHPLRFILEALNHGAICRKLRRENL